MGLRLSGVEAEWGQGLMGLRVWGFDGLGSGFVCFFWGWVLRVLVLGVWG